MGKSVKEIIDAVSEYLPQVDEDRVGLAYDVSTEIYKDRKKAEPNNHYLVMPCDIVEELLPFRPDEDTIVAALLYYIFEAKDYDLSYIEDQFGSELIPLIDGLRILKSVRVVQDKSDDKADLFRKLFMVIAKDIRVLVVFLAVKIVHMKRLNKFPPDCAEYFANDVLEIFVPIASRLGMYRYKEILEDLCFKTLHPEDYAKINRQMKSLGPKRTEYLGIVTRVLNEFLKEEGVSDVQINGRVKGYYSIYKKMDRKGLESVSDLYDLFAVRVIVPKDEISHLYEVLGLLHSHWKPLPSRFKDYVAVPKTNGYRSLHTALVGISDGGMCHPVEVQIRSENMHEEAEYGVASHWLYKDTFGRGIPSIKSHEEWLSNLENLQKELHADDSVLESVKTDIFEDRIYVLTPNGDVKDLPVGASPLDFAYAVHTDVGHQCVLSKVNGKVASLNSSLKNGDTVEIVIKKGSTPKLEWIPLVKTSAAKVKIRAWFASQDNRKHVKLGRDQLNTQLQRFGKPLLDPSLGVLKNYGGKKLNSEERERVLVEIGKGTQSASNVIRKLYSHQELLEGAAAVGSKLQKKRRGGIKTVEGSFEDSILVHGMSGVAVQAAQCCNPSKVDSMIGYVSSKAVVTIHKKTCPLIKRFNKDRFVNVEARRAGGFGVGSFYRVHIRIEADRRIGLLGDIGSRIAAHGVNIHSYKPIESSDINVAHIDMHVDIRDFEQFEKILNGIESVDGVRRVIKES
jgi:GTP diphosphokinase / guanosine-3',5'-bis(diphosphate) 3'-diphosphatase